MGKLGKILLIWKQITKKYILNSNIILKCTSEVQMSVKSHNINTFKFDYTIETLIKVFITILITHNSKTIDWNIIIRYPILCLKLY